MPRLKKRPIIFKERKKYGKTMNPKANPETAPKKVARNKMAIIMRDKKKSARDIEAATGISYPVIIYFKNQHKNISPRTAKTLADHLGVSVEELYKTYKSPPRENDIEDDGN